MIEPEDEWKSKWTVKRNHQYSPLRTNQTHLFLRLPPELRNLIFEWLGSKDCRSLRAVCALFKWDVEEVLGLSVLIKDEAEYQNNRIDQWIQRIIVKSLELEYIGCRVPYGEIRLGNPFMLHQLVLWIRQSDFSNPDKAQNLKRILSSFNGLKKLELNIWMRTISPTNFDLIFSETLKCLTTKPHLKEFRISASGDCRLGGRGFRIIPDPTHESNFQFPQKLGTLTVWLPILSRRDALNWKAFLDTQDELTEVSLIMGLVSWQLFEIPLRRSAPRLRKVTLQLCAPEMDIFQDEDLQLTIEDRCIKYNADDVEDVSEHPTPFDWSILADTRLDYLSVCRSRYPEVSLAIRSRSFRTLRLDTLTELTLISVHLSLEDLTRVLLETLSVVNLYICNWTLIAEQANSELCLSQNIRVCILLSIILQTRRITSLHLVDRSLRNFHPSIVSALQETVRNHNVQVYHGANNYPHFQSYSSGVIYAFLKGSVYLVRDNGRHIEIISNAMIYNHFG